MVHVEGAREPRNGGLQGPQVEAPHPGQERQPEQRHRQGEQRHLAHRDLERRQDHQREAPQAVRDRLHGGVQQGPGLRFHPRREGHVEDLEDGFVDGVLEAVVAELHQAGGGEPAEDQERAAGAREAGGHHQHGRQNPQPPQDAGRHEELEEEARGPGGRVEEAEKPRQLVLAEGGAGDHLELVVPHRERHEDEQDHPRERPDVGALQDPRQGFSAAAPPAHRAQGRAVPRERPRQRRHRAEEAHHHEQQLRRAHGPHDQASRDAAHDHAQDPRRPDEPEEALGRARIVEVVGQRPELHDEEVRHHLGPDVEDRVDP